MERRTLFSAVGLSLALACGAIFVLPTTAHALSCDGRLVEAGDNIAYVREVCGEPTYVTSHQEMRSVYGGYAGRYGYYGQQVGTTVQVDVLVYDFGPTRFIEQLTFENGILRNESIAGYGTTAGARARRESRREAREARARDDE